MPTVLLFNITGDKEKKLQFLLMQYGITAIEVTMTDCNRPLGSVLGKKGHFGEPTMDAPFSDEMLVMDGLSAQQFHGLLDSMRMLQAQVIYKAVTTDQNLTWTPSKLCRELAAEHAALQHL